MMEKHNCIYKKTNSASISTLKEYEDVEENKFKQIQTTAEVHSTLIIGDCLLKASICKLLCRSKNQEKIFKQTRCNLKRLF